MRRLFIALAIIGFTLPVLAQDTTEREERSVFTRFVENTLSTPDRQIRLGNIDGALSSNAKISEITIADHEGIWLRVADVAIVWSRLALLRGKLEIDRLNVGGIDVMRQPLPAEGLPAPESSSFQLPSLPVSVEIDAFEIGKASFAQEIFGLKSQMSAKGAVTLIDGSLTTDLEATRLDGPGGQLLLKAAFAQDTRQLALDMSLREEANGIFANLLKLDGRPPVALSLSGSGPLDHLDLDLSFDAGDERILTGLAMLRRSGADLAFDGRLEGPLSQVLPADFRSFFGPQTSLSASGSFKDAGGVSLDSLDVAGEAFSLNASATTAASGFLQRLVVDAQIADPSGGRVVLPVAGGQTSIERANLAIDFGDSADENWTATLEVSQVRAGDGSAARLALKAGGQAASLDDAPARRITFSVSGEASGVDANNRELAEALGDTIKLDLGGDWRGGQPLRLEKAEISAREALVSLTGEIADYVFKGGLAVRASNLAPFSGLAGRSLSGAMDMRADGEVSPISGGFDLTLAGKANDLSIDDEVLNGLLRGDTTINGRLARNEQGFVTRDLRVVNEQLRLSMDGAFATGAADFDFDLALANLSSLSRQAEGALKVTGNARGKDGRIELFARADVPSGALVGKELSQASLRFTGTRVNGDIEGRIEGGGKLGGADVSLASEVKTAGARRELNGLRFVAGGMELGGDLVQSANGLFDGKLAMDASDIGTAAALFLKKGSGAINGEIDLSSGSGVQDADIRASLANIAIDDMRVGAGKLSARIEDAFGLPKADATLDAGDLSVGGVEIARLAASANRAGDVTKVEAAANLENGAKANVSGELSPVDGGYRLSLARVDLVKDAVSARLVKPAMVLVRGSRVEIDPMQFSAGRGSLILSGSADEKLSLDLKIDDLPLSIANAIRPDLGLGGTINGSASVLGARSDPQIRFELRGDAISANALAQAGLDGVSLKVAGRSQAGAITLDGSLNAAGGLRANLGGTIVQDASSLDLKIEGDVPLSLADRLAASRGAQALGTLSVSVSVKGRPQAPVIVGSFSTRNAQFIDPMTRLRLKEIAVDGTIDKQTITLSSVSARLADGGTIKVAGTVSIDAAANFPADLRIALDSARYRDGEFVAARLSGQMSMTGPLTRDPLLSGKITVEQAEISVPERLGGGVADIDVKHKAPPPDVAATLKRSRPAGEAATPTRRPSLVRLDLTIDAPRRIFVRGRGLDAEVGGNVRLTGPVTNIVPVGAFNLIRGRLSILGQRIVFDEGSVRLAGTLDPTLYFVASAERSDLTVIVTVTGRVSAPKIAFSSQPELPEDEVLAQLIFNRGVSELSPLQIGQLAIAAAELAGGSRTSLVGSLRKATGLDDIDIVTGTDGTTGVRAGRYIRENIYLGVEADSAGQTRGTVNLDITQELKAKGSLGSGGESSVGVYFERDY